MTKAELQTKLRDSALFHDFEIDLLLQTVGEYTLGNAVIACELIKIGLTGNDIDTLFSV